MSGVGDTIERDFHDFVASLESDYVVDFGYHAAYVVVVFQGKLIEQCYTGEGRWRQKRRR